MTNGFIDPSVTNPVPADRANIVFANGAYHKLMELAAFFNIPPEQVSQVLIKGIKLIDMARNNKIIIETPDGKRYHVDLREL